MSTSTWVDEVSGDWSVGSNWSGGVVPTGTSNAVIGGSGTETVTVSSTQAANQLTLNDANLTLNVTGSLSVYGGLTTTAAHEIDVTGTLLMGGATPSLDNVTVNLGSSGSYGAQITTDPNLGQAETLTLGSHLVLNVAGNSSLNATPAQGGGSIVNAGTITVAANSTLNIGYVAFTNNGSISGAGTISGGATFINTGTITSSVFYGSNLTNSGTISSDQVSAALISNSGSISAHSGSINFNSNGVNSGTINVSGGSLTISSYYLQTGAGNNGAISVGSGGHITLNSQGSSFGGTGSFTINQGGLLELSTSSTLANGVTFNGLGVLQLDSSSQMTGTISGLADGDIIDFAHASVASAAASGTTLTVTFADNSTKTLTLGAAPAAGESFRVGLDGSGGSNVVLSNAPLPASPTYTWTDGVSGDWSVGSNWSGGVVPTGTSNAVIAGSGTETVTVSSTQAANQLTLNNANLTLNVTGSLSVYGGLTTTAAHEIDVTGYGTLLVGGATPSLDNVTVNLGTAGGGYYSNAQLTTDPNLTQAETLTLGSHLTLNVLSNSTLSAVPAQGGGSVVNAGAISVASGAQLYANTTSSFTNNGSISGAGTFSANTFNNASTVYVSTISTSYFNNSGTISSGFINGSIVSNSGSISTHSGSINFNSNGVNSGTINVSGGSLTISSYYLQTGAGNNGAISVGSGGHITLNSQGSSFGGTGSFTINQGGLLELSTSSTLANGVTFNGLGVLQLDSSSQMTGTISGLADGDIIDFAHASVASAAASGTTLTVTFADNSTKTLTLGAAPAAGESFRVGLDGSGGSNVVLSNAPLPASPTYTWTDGVSGDWSVGSNWSGGVVPTGTSNAVIAGSGTETVTVSSTQAANQLTLNNANLTLNVTGSLSVYGGLTTTAAHEIDVTGYGTLLVGGATPSLDNVTVNLGTAGGGYYSNAQLTTDPNLTQAETLTLGSHLTLNVLSNSTLSAVPAQGGGSVVNAGAISVASGAQLYANTTSSFTNNGSISGAGTFSANTFNNASTVYVSTISTSYFNNSGTISSGFINGSIVSNSGSISTHSGSINFNSNGVNSGTINVSGGSLTISSYYLQTGAGNNGAISVGSGGHITLNSQGSSFGGTGSFTINQGGLLELSTSSTLANGVTFNGLGVLQLDSSSQMTGTISGLADGDIIDFAHASVASAAASGTTLTVTFADNSTKTLTLGAALTQSVSVHLDGSGGSNVLVGASHVPTIAITAPAANGLVNHAALTLTGTVDLADAGQTVKVSEGQTNLASGVVQSDGTWSAAVTLVGDGPHQLVARETDVAGNTASASTLYTLDTAAPVVAITSAGGPVNHASQTVAGTVDTADAGTTVTVYEGATSLGTAVVQGDGSWSAGVTLTGDGAHVLVAKDSDPAGNIGTSSSVTYTLDTAAPVVAITSAGGPVNHASQTVAGTVDTADAGTTVTVYEGATSLGTAVVQGDGSWSAGVTLTGDGAHVLVAKDSDPAGNIGTSSSVTYTLDTAAPVVAITSAGGPVNHASQTVAGTVDTDDAGTTVTVYEGTTSLGTAVVQGDGSWSAGVTLTGDGAHVLVAKDSDPAGNIGTSASVTYTLSTPVSGGGGGVTAPAPPTSDQATSGDDALTANPGGDTIYGQAGNDTITGGSGHDQLYGNAGDDRITLSRSTLESTVYGGMGNDVLDASASTHANFLSGDLGDDSIVAGAGADTLFGGDGADTLLGGSGHANIYGNAGADLVVLLGTTQESTVYGGMGNDVLDASASTHANFLSGDLGDDSVLAGAGADTLYGGDGNDTLMAGAGQDQIYGNAGNDTVVIGSGGGGATVYGGQGNDLLDGSSSTHANFLSGDLGDDLIRLGTGADTAYGGAGNDSISAGSGHNHIYGNAGNDVITIGALNLGSTVYGGQGDDRIDASASTQANLLSGDLGNDSILAGTGGDTIHGGAGSDTIQAASGALTTIHAGLGDSNAPSAADMSQLDHVLNFSTQTRLVFDGDPAGTAANTTSYGGDTAIANYAAAYAYAYGDATHAAAITGPIQYAVVSDTAGHVYVFAADHAAIELDGLASGVNGLTPGQFLAA